MQRLLILFTLLPTALTAQLAMGGANTPVPQSRRQLTAPHGATPTKATHPDLATSMQRLTPKQRKQIAKAMKKLSPKEREQVAQAVNQQLAAQK